MHGVYQKGHQKAGTLGENQYFHYFFKDLPKLTLQNCCPLTELPIWSSGGDQRATHITLGTTRRIGPLTPDFAGRPTCNRVVR